MSEEIYQNCVSSVSESNFDSIEEDVDSTKKAEIENFWVEEGI